jgi:ubiquinone/menaquinone biosynthesis C-methylase UbiE
MDSNDRRDTVATKTRYGRIAPFYDFLETIPELRFRSWRERFWTKVAGTLDAGDLLLEVGVGTGKNIPFWPTKAEVTAIDLTPGMVKRARQRARQLNVSADILEGDAQELQYADNHFDAASATFVFCSVPDAVRGLGEVARAVKPGGSIILMEHVRSSSPVLGRLMDVFNPMVRSLMGPNINRNTVENVKRAGLNLVDVEDLDRGGIFKIIHARNQ